MNRTASSSFPGARYVRMVVFVLCLVTAPIFAAETATTTTATEAITPRVVVNQLIEAFNAHDPAAMAALVSEDFELYYFDEHGVAGLAIEGPEQLKAEMISYFAMRPDVQSEIAAVVDGPVFIAYREQIVGGNSSLAVYEVRNLKVRRTWYYPEEPGVE